ncbi:hypothetical protein SAMN05444481_11410 [Flavobacterium frigidimaris]|nr:hypothetical protein SAMN05444481_11410 [Flavobacterium frigidimaris]
MTFQKSKIKPFATIAWFPYTTFLFENSNLKHIYMPKLLKMTLHTSFSRFIANLLFLEDAI